MKQHFQLILAILAPILFIVAFLLGLSNFGQSWNLFWEDLNVIGVKMIVTSIAMATAFGLVLGLFFFRKKTYKQRLSWTVPIAFITFSLAVITIAAIDSYGLLQEYNYFTAKRDIKSGKIQILGAGFPHFPVDWEKQEAAQKIVEKHFGYKSVNVGCIVYNGIFIYNDVMGDYLDIKNGKEWRIKARRMRDSLLKLESNEPQANLATW